MIAAMPAEAACLAPSTTTGSDRSAGHPARPRRNQTPAVTRARLVTLCQEACGLTGKLPGCRAAGRWYDRLCPPINGMRSSRQARLTKPLQADGWVFTLASPGGRSADRAGASVSRAGFAAEDPAAPRPPRLLSVAGTVGVARAAGRLNGAAKAAVPPGKKLTRLPKMTPVKTRPQ